PADARLLQAVNLTVNEAPLTGESYSVPKGTKRLSGSVPVAERNNMVFLGTTVAQGTGTAVVTATGRETEIGRIATLIRQVPEVTTPLQGRLRSFSRLLGTSIIAVSLLLVLFGLLAGRELAEIFPVSVAVAVAAVPEGLPVAVTVILAIGMRRIVRKRALVRSMLAAETLGSTTVICADKTGTLTEGKMSVVRILTEGNDIGFDRTVMKHFDPTHEDATPRIALEIGMLCNDAHIENEDQPLEHRVVMGNPTECALAYAAHAAGLTRHELEKTCPRLDVIPFDSERKYMLTLHARGQNERILLMKGAPEIVLPMCTRCEINGENRALTPERRSALLQQNERMSNEGLRVLAVVERQVGSNATAIAGIMRPMENFVFVGLIGMKDPLRYGVVETLNVCRQAGIRIVMITGDHALTARKIAVELHLPADAKNILSGEELASISDYELEKRIRDISVYARVTPKDKLRIVDAWQKSGEVVAMTGDGINDAPALVAADIGVALGSGTDVAKDASDLVLLDNNIRSIVAAVEQGRVMFENIRKVIRYLLVDSFAEVILIGFSLLVGFVTHAFPLPLLAAQILWINIFTEGFPNLALTVEPEEREIMKEPPRDPAEPLVNSEMIWLIIAISTVSAVVGFVIFWWYWHTTGNLQLARTVVFMALGFNALLKVFSLRIFRHSLFRVNPFANRSLLYAVGAGILVQLAALFLPPLREVLGVVAVGMREWGVVLLTSCIVLGSIELIKAIFRRTHRV
ncbi:MAG: HAD-IC family P-type ATPase, partial [bacterium]